MPSVDPTILDYIAKGVGVIVAWFLVVLGWAVVNDLTVQRDRKKSDEEKIDRLRKSLQEIEDLAILHHSDSYDESRARSIGKRTKGLGLECSHLERRGVIGSDWRAVNIAVKRAITMQNFERSDHVRRSPSDEVILVLEDAFQKFHLYLMHALEQKVSEAEPLRATLVRILKRL